MMAMITVDYIKSSFKTTVEEAGCLDHFNAVQDCLTKNKDWYQDEKCFSLVKDFSECYYNSVQK